MSSSAPAVDLLRNGRDLTAGELVELCRQLDAAGAWRDVPRPGREQRDYIKLHGTDHVDVWVLFWYPGQATGLHDHDISEVGLVVVEGALTERHPRLGAAANEHQLYAGDSQRGGVGYIHEMEHHHGEPAISLHAYSPPLRRIGQYRTGPNGSLLRLPGDGQSTRLAPEGRETVAASGT